MNEPMRQVDLIPAQRADFGRPEPVPVCDEYHRRIPVPVAPEFARRFAEQLDLLRGQVLARSAVGVELPCRRYCPIYGVWHWSPTDDFSVGNPGAHDRNCPVSGHFWDSLSIPCQG